MTSRIGKRGLTLVEVLMAVTILGMGVVLMMPAMARGAYALETASTHRTVLLFSSSKMAQMELAFRQGDPPKKPLRGTFHSEGKRFSWRVAASQLEGYPGLYSVVLRVMWSRGERQFERSFETMLSQPVKSEVS